MTLCNVPGEVQDAILAYLDTCDLAHVLLVNSTLSNVALRRLYRFIALCALPKRTRTSTNNALPFPASIKCLAAIANSKTIGLRVRSLTIEFNNCDVSTTRDHFPGADWPTEDVIPLANVYSLLRRALHSMHNLRSLSISLALVPYRTRRGLTLAAQENISARARSVIKSPGSSPYLKMLANPYTILEDAPFRLTVLETHAPYDASLAHFLDSQPEILDLTLRTVSPQDRIQNDPATKFTLPSTSLPKLQHLRAIHASPGILQEFVSGRPVRSAYIPLRPLNLPRVAMNLPDDEATASEFPCLHMLKKSIVPITRLTVFSFDASLLPSVDDPKADVDPLSLPMKLFPQLAAKDLVAAAPLLTPYTKLKSLTFMAQSDGPPRPRVSADGEEEDDEIPAEVLEKWESRLIRREKRVVDAWTKHFND
ncbi:hypothetical protein ONZ45_g8665 [Pleurotus djamor]|nr:hypothetical protein ONZ45_g8665 [Pleurotus djamor]